MPIPLVALDVKQPESPLDQYAKGVQLKSLLGGQQMQSLQLQNAQQEMAANQATRQAFQQALTVDPTTGAPKIDRDKLTQTLAASGHGDRIPAIVEGFTKMDQAAATLQETQSKVAEAGRDYLGNIANTIKSAKYDPNVATTALQHALAAAPQNVKPQIQQLMQKFQQDPSSIQPLVDQQIAGSAKQRELASQETTAQARMMQATKPPEGEMPLKNPDQLNQAMAARYQVLNPGKPLPPQFTLPANATQKDFDRIDKVMNSTEQAQGTAAQQQTANGMRQAMLQLAQSGAADRKLARDQATQDRQQAAQDRQQKMADSEDEKGRAPVIGTDANGRSVLVPASQIKELGLQNPMKADADMVNKSQAARHWLTLADKTGDTPEGMGIMQLVDKMDKEGKLGTVASRWNEFMAGKVGAGDPEFAALRAKMGLSNTKLMQAHVGSRGGAFMLEHFEDLANAKKMNGPTLKAGLGSELDYMKDVAMQPGKTGQASLGNTSALPAVGQGMTRIKASDGNFHDIPSGKLPQAKLIDPKLQVVQ